MGNYEQNNEGDNEPITLKISYIQKMKVYKCYLNELLEKYIKKYANDNQLNYRAIYALYNRTVIYGDQLKKPISEIINPQDKNDKLMPLLIEKSKISNIENIEEDKIIITLTNMGNISEYKCFLTDSLEKYIKIYANDNQLNY